MTAKRAPDPGRLPVWTGDQLADALLRRCGFGDNLIRRAIETMAEELDATTADGDPDWSARGRGVDHVLTVAGLKRVERAQVDVGGTVTIVREVFGRGVAPPPALPRLAAAPPPAPAAPPAPEPAPPSSEMPDPLPPLEIQRFGRRGREEARPDGG
jgi:hypothetical protein